MSEAILFASAKTKQREIADAVKELADSIRLQLGDAKPDIAVVFLSSQHHGSAADCSDRLRTQIDPRLLIGCTAQGVIGRDEEIEDATAITMVAARIPGADLVPFALPAEEWDPRFQDPDAFRQEIGAASGTKLFIVIANPFSTPIDPVLSSFNDALPGVPVVGGMSSAPDGENVLLLNDLAQQTGLVGVAISGPFEADVLVSQGCRPVGRPFKVTSARSNMILSLEGQPPLERIREMIVDLTSAERELLGNGLFIGRAVPAVQSSYTRGGFLIRGVTGVEENSGVIAIGDEIGDGEIVQFHLRDASTAIEDLQMTLTPQSLLGPASGGLLFTCNGRGKHLYRRPNGDISTIRSLMGDLSLAGAFCAGEIGPIGGRNYLHGHTASIVLFRPPRPVETIRD